MESTLKNVKSDLSYTNMNNSITESAQLCLERMESEYKSLVEDFNSGYIFNLFENSNNLVSKENEVLSNSKDQISEFIIKSWSKNKGLFDISLNKIKESTDAVKSTIPEKMIVANIIKNISSCDDKVYANSYSYANLELVKKGDNNTQIARGVQFLKANVDKVNSENLKDLKNQFASIVGATDSKVGSIHKAVINYLRTSESKTFEINKTHVENMITEMWSIVYDFKKSSNELKKVYSDTKNNFDFFNKASKNMNTIDRAQVSYYKYCVEVLTAINSAVLSTYQEERNVYKKVVFDASQSVKKNMKASIKESYNYFSEKKSLFEW